MTVRRIYRIGTMRCIVGRIASYAGTTVRGFINATLIAKVCDWILMTASTDEAVLVRILRVRHVDPDIFEH